VVRLKFITCANKRFHCLFKDYSRVKWPEEPAALRTMDLARALEQVAKQIGVQSFKPKQVEAVESFVSGKDTFVSLPTGYGKSIIFAILPIIFDLLLGKIYSQSKCN